LLATQGVVGNALNKLTTVDIEATRQAYLRATQPEKTYEELAEENTRLRTELEALQKRNERIITAIQDNVDAILRIAREGKTDT